jgi:glycosyltransferase involved in cell wall biosynthesis
VGDYKVPDGRFLAGLTGRLVELFTDGVPTLCLSLYLSPHAVAVTDAVRVARSTGLPVNVTTVAEAVGSDVTNVVRSCVEEGRWGAAAHVLSSYLAHDLCLAVSEYTRELILAEAAEIDARHGTTFAQQCRERVSVSFPAIDVGSYLSLDPRETERVVARRGLDQDPYVLFLSRLSPAKGVDDLIAGFARSRAATTLRLVIAGTGPQARWLHSVAAASPVAERITFLDDVDDVEKPHLMASSAAFVLPSKPLPEFVETFGIVLVEKMLSGGGPVITTETGGIGEAVGDCAIFVPGQDPDAIAAALDRVCAMSREERAEMEIRARAHASQFDRAVVFDRVLERLNMHTTGQCAS